VSNRIGIKTALTFALAAVLLLAAFAAPAPASAGLLSTGTADECDPDISQAFRAWGDSAYYRLAPGGSFDSGPSWSLAGGARVVSGNEPYRVVAGTRSLSLPAGSTATSPTMCFAFGDWHARFVVRNTGSTAGQLEVDILVRNLLGVLSVLDGGTVRADGTWDPSPRVTATISNLGGLLGLTKAVSFRLKAKGTGAQFQVDNVFLDPFRSR
jgi:hypothetical protein